MSLIKTAMGVVCVLLSLAIIPVSPAQHRTPSNPAGHACLSFVKNGSNYTTHTSGSSVQLNSSGAALSLGRDSHVQMTLLNCATHGEPIAEQPLSGKVNYIFGNDPKG